MADLQISQLPALAEADLAAGDELAVVDGSAAETKRITAKALVEKGVALIDAGSIPGTALASLGTDTVNTAAIAADAVTAAEIAAGAVGASEIADGSITATEIAANTITATQIGTNAIGASELANDAVDSAAIAANAVTTVKIADANVTYAKLNLSDGQIPGAKIVSNSLTAAQIAANAIGASELADDAVDTNAIANLAVTAGKLANNSVTVDKITDGVVTGAKLATGTITATQIAANAITASELADNAVDTDAIVDDAVTAAKLAAGSVDTTALGAAAVTGAKIAGTTITAANIVAGTITATELAANSVGASEIAANAVGASELADDAVDTAAIVNAAVTNAKIADASITYAKLNLADGDIPSAKIAAGAIGSSQIAANAVGANELANNAVDTAAIADDAVTGTKIAATTITGANIAATTIAAGNIVANTLTANEIAPNAIGASELADDAVDTAAIANAAVTNDKIANTTIVYAKLNLSDGDIAGAKITSDSITATQIAADAVGASELANNAVDTNAILDDAVTGAKIAAATIEGANIATGTITATQLAADSVGASEIAANAVGASELADDAVDTAAIANLAVTGAKIAASTITAAKLSLSTGDIDGTKIAANSLTAGQIAANAITASELADNAVDTAAIATGAVTATEIATNAVTATELADNAVDTAAVANGAITTAKIADGAVTTAKLSGTIEAGTLAAGSVTTAKIADDAVTAAKLGAGAVDTTALGATSVTTAKIAAGAVTDAKVATGISGAKLTDGTVTAAKLLTSDIDRSLNVASGKLGINNTISAGVSAGISYNAQGLITGSTALTASDLPVATTSAVGGVSISSTGGLAVTGGGAISIAATITGTTATKVTFNNFGQITATSTLAASDLPVATASAVGAVSVPTGGPLSVDSNGAITVSNSGVTAGTGTKVTVDAKGIVTTLATLTSSDLPAHSAALITSGTIGTARIAADAVTGTKLANASTTLFGSVSQTGFPASEFTGQFFFDSVSEDLYIYDGNAYQPITTLTKGSLVFGGTFNAATSKVAAVTTAGAAAGLSVGSNVPTPGANTDGIYLVVENAGTPSAPAPVVLLSPPDYILGVTNTSGSTWEEIDLSQTVAGQVASNITCNTFGQLNATNVQDALEELETEKLAKAGGTVTGQVLLGNTATLVFEGSSSDQVQTTLGVVNPTTANKTILLPNTSGTLITNNDSGTITSAMIADGAILNADINNAAEIAFTKLAALTSAQILVGNGSNKAAAVAVTGDIAITNAGVTSIAAGVIVNADINTSAGIAGSKVLQGTTSARGTLQLTDAADSTSTTTAATPAAVKIAKDAADAAATTATAALAKTGGVLTGNLTLDDEKELRFREEDAGGDHYIALKAAASLAADVTLTLPATAPTTGQVLKAGSTATTLEWATDTTNTAAADLTGTTLASNVVASSLTSVGTLTSLTVSGTITGDVTGDLTGNADTATILATARTIGGVSFNGSANIDLPGVNTAGNQNTTGNAATATLAATATALATARAIGGVNFDGTAPIDLPGVNAAGTQDTSGTAAVATTVNVQNGTASGTTYLLFAGFGASATGNQGPKTNTSLTYNPSTGMLTSTGFTGALTGNAATATALATARAINGVNFDGSAPITITAAAGTLSGATLASGVTASSLTSVGTLTGLTTSGDINLNAQADLRFKDADSSHYVALQSPASVASSFTLTLPSSDAAVSGYVLASNGSGTLSWVDPGSSSSPTFTGDATLTNDGALVGFSNLNATYTGNAKTLTVTVASKTGAHRYSGSGSGSGYKIDGKESPFLTLTPGRTYKFDQADNSNSGHPLRFYLEADRTTAYTTDVSNSGTPGSAGAFTQIIVSDTTPQVLHYQCSAHPLMGNSVQTNSNVAAAGSLNGTTLASGVIASSLTSVGTLGSLAVSGNATVGGNATITGNLVVNGTTTTVSSTTVEVADKNIELGKVSSPDDTTADGGGLTLKGATDKTWNWVNSTDAWTSSEHIQVASGKTFIGDGSTLTALNASNLSSGTVNVARLGSGSSVTTKFLRGDNTWQTVSSTPEGTAILSTGESGATKFLREDGDGTCSWQSVPAGVTIANQADNRIVTATGTTNALNGESGLTYNGGTLAVSGGATLTSTLSLANNTNLDFGTSLAIRHFTSNPSGSGWISGEQSAVFSNTAKPINFYNYVSGSTTWQPHLTLDPGGAVTAYHNGTARIATSSSGATLTGTLIADGLTIGVNEFATFGSNLRILHENTSHTNRITTLNDKSLDINYYTSAGGGLYKSFIQCYATTGGVSISHAGTPVLTTSTAGLEIVGSHKFVGDLTGNADTVTVTADNGTDSTHYPLFAGAASGHLAGETDNAFTYNPSAGYLSATRFIGRLQGSASQVGVYANNTTDETVYLTFVDGPTLDQELETDTGLTYNPSSGLLTSTAFSGSGASLTSLNASNISSGTIAAARVPTLNQNTTGSAGSFTAGSASNLNSGTLPDARFPSTLPAASGANLTALNGSNISSGTIAAARVATLNQNTTGSAGSFTAGSASNLNSGTLPDARFPATLPAISGANLTNLPGGTTYTAITSNTSATAGTNYLTNTTSAAFTVTLPSSPSAGDTVVVADAGGTWATNSLTVARNGQKIMASASNLTCNVNGAVVSLIYSGVTANGWIATPN